MNKIIAAAILLFTVVTVAAVVVQSRAKVRKSMEASVECKDGHKWIRNREGKLIEWITANGMKPTC